MALKVGQKAPEFQLPDTENNMVSLQDNLPCIVYFYPKDFTPGCTEEACSFRDNHQVFSNLDIKVFGISKDSISSHRKFKEKHQLPFKLLSDREGKVCKDYKALMPIIGVPKRITYLIDKEKTIRATYSDMFGATNHIKSMINQLKAE
ncbi:peroxiredoxin [Roseivirga sp.]|uniref:peroxiredoxin n=1 Tax=Roseivirga sp. TaxID=1964215 RepID=UPI003B52551F